MQVPASCYRCSRSVLCLLTVILTLLAFPQTTSADLPDTLDLQLQWSCPLVVRDMRLVDFDGDGINELLVGFVSDSARVGILDLVTQTWRWQSPAFHGTIYTVAAGDRDSDGDIDIVCVGQLSDTSVGYVEVYDGPTFEFADSASGFDQIVSASAILARHTDSLPEIFLGTTRIDRWPDEGPMWQKTGHLFVLEGQSLEPIEVMFAYQGGAVTRIATESPSDDGYRMLFVGGEYYYGTWGPMVPDLEFMDSGIKVYLWESPHYFSLYHAYIQGGPGSNIWLDALIAGSFDSSSFGLIIGSSHEACLADWKTKLACWNFTTMELEWSFEWAGGWYNHISGLGACNLNSALTNAVCAVYPNGLIEFRSAASGSVLAVSPRNHSIYHMELGDVDGDSPAEICVASTDSLYVYESPYVTTDVEEAEPSSVARGFSLRQNYPNPFNPETAIRFSLPFTCDASIAIYNILGERVRIFERSYPAGTHTLTWDGKNSSGEDVASGIYFYRLVAKDYQDTKKMVLVR
jgi:hypothetical protein